MAFRATNVVPDKAYTLVRGAAVQMKLNLESMRARLSSQNADYEYLRAIYSLLKNANAQFDSLKTTPGLAQYAKDAENDQAYDVAAEFAAMQAAIASALAWMDANVPTNVTAKAPADWGEGTIISNEFTPAQTAGLRTQLAAVEATIS